MNRTPVPVEFKEFATEPQVNYLNRLRDGKDLGKLTAEQRAWLADADFTKVPKRRASQVIDSLKELPWATKQKGDENLPKVPDGRYAVRNSDGTLRFYSVKQGTYMLFIDVWASDTRWPVKNHDERRRILKEIEKDEDAGPRFGREIGRCYICGRTLTDARSRALGIGPVCRGDE